MKDNEYDNTPSVGGARGIRALRKNRDPEQENIAPKKDGKKSARVDAARAYLADNVDPLMAEIINFLLSNQPQHADQAILSFLEARKNNEEYKIASPSKRSSDRNAVLRDRQYMARTVQPVLERLMKRVVEDQPLDVEAHFIKQLKLGGGSTSSYDEDVMENDISKKPSSTTTAVKTSLTNRIASDALFRMLDENFAGKLSPQQIRDSISKFNNIGVPIDSLALQFWLKVNMDIDKSSMFDKATFFTVMESVALSKTSDSWKLSSFYIPKPVPVSSVSTATATIKPKQQPAPPVPSPAQPTPLAKEITASSSSSTGLVVGTPVTVNYKKSGNYYPGKIKTVRPDGCFDITYEDGDSEMKVPSERIQVQGAVESPPSHQVKATVTPTVPTATTAAAANVPTVKPASEMVGLSSRVEVNYKKSGNFFIGSVASVNANGTFNIGYDDGDSESNVPLERIKLLNPITAQVIPVPGSASDQTTPVPAVIAAPVAAAPVAAAAASSLHPVIALVGISGAGKSTLLKAMGGDPDPKPRPTTGFSQKKLPFEVRGKEVTVHLYDLPGSWTGKWEGYLTECHGVVFVADSSADEETIAATKQAFQDTVNGPAANGKPLLLLVNKQDAEGARGIADVCKLLGCDQGSSSSNSTHVVSSTVHPERNGGEFDSKVEEGLEWLLETVASRYDELDKRVKKDAELAAAAAAEEKLDRHRRVFTKLLKEKAFPEDGKSVETFSREDSYEFLAMELLIHDPQNPEKTRTLVECYGLSDVAKYVVHLVGCQKMAMIMVADMINPENKKTKTTHSWDEVVEYVKDRREDAGLSRDIEE
jgi:small GTP-binding protein